MIGRLTHFAVASMTAASLVVAPVCAQTQQAQTKTASGQMQDRSQAQSSSQPQTQPAAPAQDSSRAFHLAAGPDYSKGPHWFPDITAPYRQIHMEQPVLTNTPRLAQLIQDGKLMLSLDDAISIALENNLDINIQRFTPWIAQTDVLRTEAGGVARGTGSSANVILGNTPITSFDPVFTSNLNWQRASIPVNNPFTSGSGLLTRSLINNNANVDFGYSQGFHTGTAVSIQFNNNRGSTSGPAQFLNPFVQSTMIYTVQQQLLNGFGLLPNTRFILEAKNTLKAADLTFSEQVITTVSIVETDYWELVFARENVKVQQAAVATSQKLYEDNKKQLEIGTMAPLDVLTAESELATDTQNLIVAQTTKLQTETILLNAITKNPVDSTIAGVEVVPTTGISTPDVTENMPLPDAVTEAWRTRPELKVAELNLKNAGIEVKATKNALLPQLTLFGQYSATGLGGNATTTTATPTAFALDPNFPIFDSNGVPVQVGGLNLFGTTPLAFLTTKTVTPGGLNDALHNMIENNFPTYTVGMNFTLPIRNRSAQADSARALLTERQEKVQYQQLQNTIVVDVRNAQIALQQDRARVAAAQKARELAQQTLDAEQKKYQLGSSTSYQVVLRSRDLTTAQGNELRAKVDLEEAVVVFDRAMGRTLDVNHITVADAVRGKVYHAPLIPGTTEIELASGK